MYIKREIQQKALELLSWSPSITLLGPRQIGKTTLAKELQKQIKKNTLYLDLENISDVERIRETNLFFEDNKDNCIIIDEIQRMPELFNRLRSIIDDYKIPSRFILLGSASPTILKKASESLTGRTIYLELSGILFKEIKDKIDIKENWLKGGFPFPLLSKINSVKNPWFQSVLKNYLELELPQLGLNVSSLTLNRFLMMVANSNGNLWNASNFSKSLSLSNNTINYYRDFFEKTYMVRTLPPFFSNTKKRLVKSPKVYLRDNGILHYLLNINNLYDLLGHPIVGNSWEGFVIEQIISYINCISDDLLNFSFYRTREESECDLVISKGIKPLISVEIKLSEHPKITKGLINAIKNLNTEHNFIIIPKCKIPYRDKNNIQVTDLNNFYVNLEGILK